MVFQFPMLALPSLRLFNLMAAVTYKIGIGAKFHRLKFVLEFLSERYSKVSERYQRHIKSESGRNFIVSISFLHFVRTVLKSVRVTSEYVLRTKFHYFNFNFEFCPNGIENCPSDVKICPSDVT